MGLLFAKFWSLFSSEGLLLLLNSFWKSSEGPNFFDENRQPNEIFMTQVNKGPCTFD